MSNQSKLILGFLLGFIGYCAYKKLKETQTVEIISEGLNLPSYKEVGSDRTYQMQIV